MSMKAVSEALGIYSDVWRVRYLLELMVDRGELEKWISRQHLQDVTVYCYLKELGGVPVYIA